MNSSLLQCEVEAASLGIVKLDYSHPWSKGEICCSDSFAYDVYYRAVPGLTFEICQSGKMTEEVEKNFIKAIKWLVKKKVRAITGNCGFMMYFQHIARQVTNIPVFMSSLCILPAVTCAFAPNEQIVIMSANDKTLEPMRNLIRSTCGVDTHEKRYIIVGCQDVDGFEAVAKGDEVDYDKVVPGIVKKAIETIKKYPKSRAILLECTQLPPFADAIRYQTGLPVFDIIVASNFFIESFQDNPRFGLNGWQKDWDGVQDEYKFGDNLAPHERTQIVHKNMEFTEIISLKNIV